MGKKTPYIKEYPLNQTQYVRFCECAKINPELEDWWVASVWAGWTTVSVPNWTGTARDFYFMVGVPV